ncbi:MAG: hypothetical protein J7K75_12945 [Desulfuromonas sp.]|nr:hypothetical protein [Desulfuromonas sp.]
MVVQPDSVGEPQQRVKYFCLLRRILWVDGGKKTGVVPQIDLIIIDEIETLVFEVYLAATVTDKGRNIITERNNLR